MSVADLHDLELVWPSLGPIDVIVTGTFDQWSASIRLVEGDTGFSGTVKVPWGEKVSYKFIVDGLWRCRDDRPQEDDGHGNINNVLRTPDKPLPPAHDPPARLSIPLESDWYSDVENMVTAVEFLPEVEPAAVKGSLPLPIPQISVEGLGQVPSAGTPVTESKLDTAAATEGHVPPTWETPAKLVPFKEEPSCDVATLPTSDDGPVTVNGSEAAHDPHGNAFIRGESTSPVPETVKETVLESATPPPPLQTAQDIPTLTGRTDTPPASTLATVSEPAAKQPQREPAATAAQGHRQHATSPAAAGGASTPSTPASSTLTHKKRRSLFARIKHIFDKDKDRHGKKEDKH